jgi:hypothetical protein
MSPSPDLLAGLRDIHLPEPVPFWPPAPGWWMLLALCAGAVAAALLWGRARRRSLRRAALAELETLRRDFDAGADAALLARGLSRLVRRVALVRFGAKRVASLHGEAWCRFLVESGGSGGFTPPLAGALAQALYRRPDGETRHDASAWIEAVRGWIRGNT